MRTQLFLDTNVILDLTLDRSEFVKNAESLFELKDQGKVDIYISALTLATVAYFADKHKLNPFSIGKSLNCTDIGELEAIFFKQVLASDFLDFEDGSQYFSTTNVKNIKAIITRNIKDFKSSLIPVLTPAQSLSTFEP